MLLWNAGIDFLLGVGLGALGLVPFLHTNTLLAGLPSASPLLVVVLAFSHLAFETLPAVFFGIPAESQGVSALPAHDLVRRGKSRLALDAAMRGLLFGIVGAAALSVPFWFFGPSLGQALRPLTAGLLAALAILVWVSDGCRIENALALGVFGAMGFAVFSLPLREPLFPLLSGLFGIPAVLFSTCRVREPEGPMARLAWSPPLAGSVLGAASVFLPALSPSWAASVAFLFLPAEPVAALGLVSAVSSSRLVFDFLAVFVLEKARSSPSVRWKESHLAPAEGVVLLAVGLLAFILSWLLAKGLARAWCRVVRRISSRTLSASLLALAFAGAWALDGAWGLFVLSWTTAVSVLALRLQVPRKYALGVLVGPAAVYAWTAA
ncbi:tripartite tricarboxylate transporter permease [Candidatus Micrarchaeota archaeon]|nr:tripartite tricarboxylate transporter permease [Candidatus Micrarchaeota archaeon]